MIKRTIIFCIAISSILFGFKSSAQESNSNVTITASGRGDSQAQAQQYALRSAIEQAYGAFISSKTEILNDEIVADQMASVASGNIQSFEILNETELPDHSWASTIKAVVSVEKLTSFVQSKGIEVEIKGGLFAANIKQQMLNEQGEVEAIYNMVGVLHEVMQNGVDFSITTENPKAVDELNQLWQIPISIHAIGNQNLESGIVYLKKTLLALNMPGADLENYKLSNKPVFQLSLNYLKKVTLISGEEVYSDETLSVTLRRQKSIEIINDFFNSFKKYLTNFQINETYNDTKSDRFLTHGKNFNISDSFKDKINSKKINGRLNENQLALTLKIKSGTLITEFHFSDQKTIDEINRLNGYSVIPSTN